jgi:hypothetical protein
LSVSRTIENISTKEAAAKAEENKGLENNSVEAVKEEKK